MATHAGMLVLSHKEPSFPAPAAMATQEADGGGAGVDRGEGTGLWLTIHREGQALLPSSLCPQI